MSKPFKAIGVSRDAYCEKAIILYFGHEPITDDEMRIVQDTVFGIGNAQGSVGAWEEVIKQLKHVAELAADHNGSEFAKRALSDLHYVSVRHPISDIAQGMVDVEALARDICREVAVGRRIDDGFPRIEDVCRVMGIIRAALSAQDTKCSYPDCGCPEARLCNEGKPNSAAVALNRAAQDTKGNG